MLQPATFGRAVRAHREAAGLSRRALSELAGVGITALYDVEHGKETVQLRTLLRLLDALNIDLRLESPLMERLALAESPTTREGPDAHR
jgi:HTH-type transcriptional regulator/antitoxin HipB